MDDKIIKRNNVRISGVGDRTMLFAHGFGCDQNMWRYVAPTFEADYRVVTFDYVGAGKSDVKSYNPQRYETLNGYVQDVLDVCEALELTQVVFVGHSVSSMVGILAAIKRPDIFSSLILIGPSPCYINDDSYIGGFERSDVEEMLETMDKNYIGWANFLAPAIIKNPERPELAAELTESFCSTDPQIARQFAKATFLSDNRLDLKHFKKPSLIMQCSDDIIAPLAVGQYLHENIEDSDLRILDATGHCPHLTDPEETIAIMRDYLDGK